MPELIRLVNNDNEAVRKLAADLLQERDPRTDVGLDAWGQLLETRYGHDLASRVLKKSFGARELTLEWFADRLFSSNHQAFNFAKGLLPQVHPFAKLGPVFFAGLIDRIDDANTAPARNVANFVDLITSDDGGLDDGVDDDIVRAVTLARGGEIVSPHLRELLEGSP